MGPGTWPVTLRRRYRGGELGLRPLHPRRDLQEWSALRAANRRWTGPWDSTSPYPEPALGFKAAVKEQNVEARAGRLLPWAMTWNGALAGQVHIFTIVRGAQQGGTIGYWIGERFAGHGLTPMAVAMAADHAFGVERLHRLEINVRPDNANSLRVVEKLGWRDEGVRREFLHIDGAWRDHRTFALLRHEVDGTLVQRVENLERSGSVDTVDTVDSPQRLGRIEPV